MHKPFLIILGLILVGLAVLGIFLPVLPTTPLLLLALACFARSSEKLHTWLLNSRVLGPFIKQWQETRSMSRRAKAYALISVAAVGLVSVYSLENIKMRLLLAAVLVIPVVIILKIKTTESL